MTGRQELDTKRHGRQIAPCRHRETHGRRVFFKRQKDLALEVEFFALLTANYRPHRYVELLFPPTELRRFPSVNEKDFSPAPLRQQFTPGVADAAAFQEDAPAVVPVPLRQNGKCPVNGHCEFAVHQQRWKIPLAVVGAFVAHNSVIAGVPDAEGGIGNSRYDGVVREFPMPKAASIFA